jgi:hypothetical protein
MRSPFPGMDPYLEQATVWHDFHESMIYECRRLLVPQISPAYVAKLDEHIYVHELGADERRFMGRGDMTVAERPDATATASLIVPSAITAPVQVELPSAVDLERESRIEIRDRDSGQVVTVIELLSPANKQPGQDRRQFLGKRDELLASEANYIEIDLLRGGPRVPVDDLPECEYYALVSRPAERPKADLWPIRLTDRLPTIPIPLQPPDADATLDLRQALDQAFEAGGYAVYIYRGTPDPPLTPDQQAWADERLQTG